MTHRQAPLTVDQHKELGRLLNQAAQNLSAAATIVARANFSERTLHVAGNLQEWLIDPLREAYNQLGLRSTREEYEGPYQSVGYISRYRRKAPPKTKVA